jgi:hypothetical protein
MTTYRKVRKLNLEEAAYIAGLIDGEGSISLTRKHQGFSEQVRFFLVRHSGESRNPDF